MSIEQMRYAITKVYQGEKWNQKVSRMCNEQVIAVYHKFFKLGKLK